MCNVICRVFITSWTIVSFLCHVQGTTSSDDAHHNLIDNHVSCDDIQGEDVHVYHYEQRITDRIVGNSTFRRLSRPVDNVSDPVMVTFNIGLVQIVELNEKNEVFVTRLWVTMQWQDEDISWKPEKCGNLTNIRLHTKLIWTPDISLYNTAESSFDIPMTNLATIHHNGTISWAGPVLFRSSCFIDVTYFPFDWQNCSLKLGPWSYPTDKVDLIMKDRVTAHPHLGAVDMSSYWISDEWLVMEAYGIKRIRLYQSTAEALFSDVTYYFILKRLSMYYTVNVLIPCFEISFITLMLFILPVESSEKITLCTSVLVLLTVFLILIFDVVPSTSHVVPLLGQFLLSTTILVSLSICLTSWTVSIHCRQAKYQSVPWLVRKVFIETLARWLLIRFSYSDDDCTINQWRDIIDIENLSQKRYKSGDTDLACLMHSWEKNGCAFFQSNGQPCFGKVLQNLSAQMKRESTGSLDESTCLTMSRYYSCHFVRGSSRGMKTKSMQERRIEAASENLIYICERLQRHRTETITRNEWKLVSRVADRILLFVYVIVIVAISFKLIYVLK